MRAPLHERLFSAFLENIPLKLLSLGFAVALWGWVQGEQVIERRVRARSVLPRRRPDAIPSCCVDCERRCPGQGAVLGLRASQTPDPRRSTHPAVFIPAIRGMTDVGSDA